MCKENKIYNVEQLSKEAETTRGAVKYWLQSKGINWDSVRHSVAYLELIEEGWWDNAYPLHPDEPFKAYHGIYCSAWGAVFNKKTSRKGGFKFYKFVEIGSYGQTYCQVTTRHKGEKKSEYVHLIIAKLFLDKTPQDRVVFKNGNTYDCHIYNLTLEDKNLPEKAPNDDVLDEWECTQCKACIVDSTKLYFHEDHLFCSENCSGVWEEDLKFVDVSVDNEEGDWYTLLHYT